MEENLILFQFSIIRTKNAVATKRELKQDGVMGQENKMAEKREEGLMQGN